jgi:hypothetical protein
MKTEDVQKLHHGLYKIYWKTGGTSLAAVGSRPNGDRWIAPCNWVNGVSTTWGERNVWREVEKVKLIREAT